MSKVHPNCSEKYKKQTDIRKQREGKRNVLDDVKEKLFKRYNLDYRKMKKNDEKEKIKSFIKSHQKEYEIFNIYIRIVLFAFVFINSNTFIGFIFFVKF